MAIFNSYVSSPEGTNVYHGIPVYHLKKKWLFYDEDPWDFGALLLHKERTCASGVEAQTSSR